VDTLPKLAAMVSESFRLLYRGDADALGVFLGARRDVPPGARYWSERPRMPKSRWFANSQSQALTSKFADLLGNRRFRLLSPGCEGGSPTWHYR